MAQNNSAWARYRKKEEERSAAAKKKKSGGDQRESVTAFARQDVGQKVAPVQASDLDVWVEQVPILIDQLNHLYIMYFQGIEKRAPIERRKLLESLMYKIQNAAKSSTVTRFRAQTLVTQIQSQLEKWDKQLRAREKHQKKAA